MFLVSEIRTIFMYQYITTTDVVTMATDYISLPLSSLYGRLLIENLIIKTNIVLFVFVANFILMIFLEIRD